MFHYNNAVFKKRRRELRSNQSLAEQKLWKHLRKRQLSGLKFFRQYSIGLYILDFYCPEMRLAIEVDGGQHGEEKNRKYDEKRTEYLAKDNIKVLRFWNNDVLKNTEAVLEKIKKEITLPDLPLF